MNISQLIDSEASQTNTKGFITLSSSLLQFEYKIKKNSSLFCNCNWFVPLTEINIFEKYGTGIL